ncbi:OmpP1/FadL family transporter [Acinetobacter sichuanensis]|uniref:Transporter n=1 Tax=Acinetobacter sichuanensis TaxID=2136183 RepID=A0A371YNM7_9GAMM|nr:outer membrane protein transport protein [Acinetobacter sichuanensis]RFC83080.1 transporter [Acinetobacter sichuanensis]
MRMQPKLITIAISLISVGSITQTFAQGYAVNEQSISAMGSAYAGRGANVQDASILYGNPAGITQLEHAEISQNLTFVKAYSDLKNTQGSGLASQGSNDGDFVPEVILGSSYASVPLNHLIDGLSAGLGIYVPFGISSNYETNFQGSVFGDKTKVKVVTIQPTIAYEINPKISVGLGATINRMDGEINQSLTGQTDRTGLKGEDFAGGYNLGLLLHPTEKTHVGLTYHSKVEYKLKDTAYLKGLNPMALLANPQAAALLAQKGIDLAALPPLNALNMTSQDASLKVTTPESAELSVSYQVTPNLNLLGSATWTRWSRLGTLSPETGFSADLLLAQNAQLAGLLGQMLASGKLSPEEINQIKKMVDAQLAGNHDEVLKFKDNWMFNVGAEYRVNPHWKVRAGYAYDQSPVDTEHRTVRLPLGNRNIVSLGANYQATENTSIDAGYMYIFENTARVHQEKSNANYSAEYKNTAHTVGLQLNHRF